MASPARQRVRYDEHHPARLASDPPTPIRAGATLSSRHIPQLDGLRGCAVLMVMLLHFTSQLQRAASPGARLFVNAFSFGWAGVDIFFVLSGFLITGILYDAKDADAYFRPFYARRTLRIMPLYYGTLIALYVLAPLVAAAPQADWHELRWYVIYLGNFRFESTPTREWIGHFWSLAIEEQFYLVWPLVIRFSSRRRALLISVCAIVGSLTYRVAALHFDIASGNVYHVTPARLDGLAVGAAIALLWRDPADAERLRRWRGVAAATALLVLAAIVVRRGWPIPLAYETVTIGYSAVALLAGALLASTVLGPESALLTRALRHPALTFWGTYSYALYVVHVPLIAAMKRSGFHPTLPMASLPDLPRAMVYTGAMIALSLATALASWHLLEKHFLRLKRFVELTHRGDDRLPIRPADTRRSQTEIERSSSSTRSMTPSGSAAAVTARPSTM